VPSTSRIGRVIVLAASLAAAGAVGVPGCGGGGGGGASINTGLSRAGASRSTASAPAPKPETKPATPAWASVPPVDVQAILDKPPGEAPANRVYGTNDQPPAPITSKDGPTKVPASDGSTVTVSVDPPDDGGGVRTVAGNPERPHKPLAERIDDTIVSLIDLLTQQSMAGAMPWRNYIALAALDAVHPGALPKVITPDQKEGGPLSADDRQAVESLREFFAGVAAIPPEIGPDARADRMAELADKLLESRPMRIRTAALCSRVTGYGQFTPLRSTRFAQGRAIRAIVYAEIARFGHRPIAESSAEGAGGDRWAVELTQTLQLYHDSDGLLAWSRPEERILETSRNKRQDFFLVHEITLPPTLSIGAYRLKVIMKDTTTGHVDEAIIPIEIVTESQASAP
jgi:hypothetical protein